MRKRMILVTWRLLITGLLTFDQTVHSSPTQNFERVTELDMNSHSNVASCKLVPRGPPVGRRTIAEFEGFPGSPELPVGNQAPSPTGDVVPGSSTVASDIYGLGVRLGFYFQACGMVLTLPRRSNGGGGLKLACGSVSLSILVSWTILTTKKLFSPCEAFLTLLMTTTVIFPATKTVFSSSDHEVGEGLGLFLTMVTEAWVTVAMILTLAIEVRRLPLLGTENLVFFFAKVTLTGAYRWVFLILYTINVPFFISKFIITMKKVWALVELYCDGTKEADAARVIELPVPTLMFLCEFIITSIVWASVEFFSNGPKEPNGAGEMEMHVARLGFFSRIVPMKMVEVHRQRTDYICSSMVLTLTGVMFLIVSVEMTIKWNHLIPVNDMQAPAQLIPLITGFLVLLDGLLFLFHPRPPQTDDVPDENL